MDNINQPSYNTQLCDRILWYDGSSVYRASNILSLLKKGYSVKWVDQLTPDIVSYNNISSTPIQIKTECDPLSPTWNIPDSYRQLDPISYVIDKHVDKFSYASIEEQQLREIRLAQELSKYKELQLLDVLRAIIYIVDVLTKHEIVWGIGRGSSVSSYVLYVLGAHEVDSYRYDLDLNDFLHE